MNENVQLISRTNLEIFKVIVAKLQWDGKLNKVINEQMRINME